MSATRQYATLSILAPFAQVDNDRTSRVHQQDPLGLVVQPRLAFRHRQHLPEVLVDRLRHLCCHRPFLPGQQGRVGLPLRGGQLVLPVHFLLTAFRHHPPVPSVLVCRLVPLVLLVRLGLLLLSGLLLHFRYHRPVRVVLLVPSVLLVLLVLAGTSCTLDLIEFDRLYRLRLEGHPCPCCRPFHPFRRIRSVQVVPLGQRRTCSIDRLEPVALAWPASY